MTDNEGPMEASRQMRLETDHGKNAIARSIARSIEPDNTDEMETRVEGGRVVTEIERETTGGLHSTADDYVVNLQVAAQLANQPDASGDDPGVSTRETHGTQDRHDT